ncbi:hypothetical protein ACQPXH_15865 [Nocardia sp. CA-135953]|uniref:hypothetical protein n=1 Tax=Nocardia sp. CA-135953 TaxID=3239978 RepID=UPI003D9561DA
MQITRRWLEHPEELTAEFGKAWFAVARNPRVVVGGPKGSGTSSPSLWPNGLVAMAIQYY